MTEGQITGFLDKLKEAITKFQGTLPKQLPQEGIDAIMALMNESVRYNFEMGTGYQGELTWQLYNRIIAPSYDLLEGDDERTKKYNESLARDKAIVGSSETLKAITEEELDRQMPRLWIAVHRSELSIQNHENKYLYDSTGEHETTNNYLLKSEAQFKKEQRKAFENRNAEKGRED